MRCPFCDGTGEMTGDSAPVGALIAKARKRLGKTQAELADAIGMTRSNLANIETGRISLHIEHVRPVADVLGIPVSDLIP